MQLAGDSAYHTRAYPPVPPVQSESQPLLTLSEKIDDWDSRNQAKMKQLEQTQPNSQDLYERFQQMREVERKEMEARNLVDSHDVRRSLDDAIAFVGSCTEMCPVYERVRREFQRNVKGFELENGKISPSLAVKAFSRPAAGQPPALPSDVRPPSILVKTLGYLLDRVVPALPESHPFLWDRTRSIRQDFTYQNYAGPEAVECTEIICRIHALCLHVMIGNPDWSEQQELEQFNKSLRTLDEQYSLRPERASDESRSEPEVRGMQLLIRIFDPETAYKIESLPSHITNHPLVRLAMKIRSLVFAKPAHPSQYFKFFELVRDPNTPLLFQIICQVHFPTIRSNLILALRKSLHKKSMFYSIDRFASLLGFDDSREAVRYFEKTKLKFEKGVVHLDTWEDNLKPGSVKSNFIERNLDLSVLSADPALGPGAVNSGQQRAEEASTSYFKLDKLGYTPSNGSAPAKVTFSGLPAPTLSSHKSSPTPEEPVVKVTPRPIPPSIAEIRSFVETETANIVKMLVSDAAKAAARQIQQQRYEQQQRKDLYLYGIAKELTSDILQSITGNAAFLAIKAANYRRHNLLKLAVSTLKLRAALELKTSRDKIRENDTARDFIETLTRRSAPKRSVPLQAVKYTSPSPAPTASATPIHVLPESDDNEMSIVEDKSVRMAIKSASEKGAKLIMIMANWNSHQGNRLKNMFALDHEYQSLVSNVLITPDSTDRPDITLNFLDRRLDNYISFEPVITLADRICEEIGRYSPAFQAPKLEEVSVDSSTNVSIFLPSKRTFSGFSTPRPPFSSKRQSMPRSTSRAVSGVEDLKRLMEETKKLIK